MRNKYVLTRTSIILNLIKRKKITFKKIWNALLCYFSYFFRLKKSATFPLLISFEFWNDCNANCRFCRNEKGEIHDLNPTGTGKIPKGQMDVNIYKNIIEECKNSILMATLYVNGEPLLYKHIYECVRFATVRRVPSMIATNGTLLNEKNGRELLEAGIDFVKIALSGFSQETYGKEVRHGDVEKIKKNIETFVLLNKNGRYGTVILIDFMLYNFNRHELPLIKKFCEQLNVMLNIRPGNPVGLENLGEFPQEKGIRPVNVPCDWLWKVLTVNFNGDLLPCCDFVAWSQASGYEQYVVGKTKIKDVWNGPNAMRLRKIHKQTGRKTIPICQNCLRTGVAFKW